MTYQAVLFALVAVVGLTAHLGTAALRVRTFVPYPKLLDFSAFYASAWALQRGSSPYDISEALLEAVQTEKGIPFRPPPIYNPPVWPWLLQPLTFTRFSTAASIWLIVQLAQGVWITGVLTRLAGYEKWPARSVVLVLTVTFGPLFLDLTLGQTSVILLTCTLVVAQGLRTEAHKHLLLAGAAQGLAVAAKLFPAVWLGAFALLRRPKLLALGMLATLLVLGLGFLVSPQGNEDYWFRFLPERIASASDRGGLDDQSLAAWLDRLGRPQSYQVPGLWVSELVHVTWLPPWSIDPYVLHWCGYVLAALLGLPVLWVLWQSSPNCREAGFYLWILYILLVFPHTERYNHVLLLPAMAWLWSQGRRQRIAVILAYTLTGLSRLNHLWTILLPVPWGPLASGFGLYAVLLLAGVMVSTIRAKLNPELGSTL